MSDHPSAKDLLTRYKNGECSDAEKRHIERWWLFYQPETVGELSEDTMRKDLAVVQQQIHLLQPVRVAWYKVAAVAAVFLLGAFALVRYFNPEKTPVVTIPLAMNDVSPGGNKAVLKLAGGQTFTLDSTQTGITVAAGKISYQHGNALWDASADGGAVAGTSFNTLITPKGGTYQITLEDGTRVWLNAASSLRYPEKFSTDCRCVEVEGEAYFEVAPVVGKGTGLPGFRSAPFVVKSAGQQVTVLGTWFNIRAYGQEGETRTTLVEGKVKVNAEAGSGEQRLVPGEQSILNVAGSLLKKQVDVEEAIAWKNGRISLEGKPFRVIMDELSRWYDLEVIYEGEVPDVVFYGDVVRGSQLSTVLRLLESGGITYKLEGRKLFVYNKNRSANTSHINNNQ